MNRLSLITAIFIFGFYGIENKPIGIPVKPTQSTETAQTDEINKLRAVVRDARLRRQDPKQVTSAINRLGELKAEPAIGDLISILTFRQEFSEVQQEMNIISDGFRYPAINALWQIGKPALAALSAVIASNDARSIESKNATYTVMLIFRDAPKLGVNYLEDQASKAQNRVAVSRFRAAAEQLRKIANLTPR
jgi:hypothetical protein